MKVKNVKIMNTYALKERYYTHHTQHNCKNKEKVTCLLQTYHMENGYFPKLLLQQHYWVQTFQMACIFSRKEISGSGCSHFRWMSNFTEVNQLN